MEVLKAVGYLGSWFVRVENELLPCIHRERILDKIYTEPYVEVDKAKWPKFVSAIRDGKRVIVTRSVMKNGAPTRRTGYRGVYRIEDFSLSGQVMKFGVMECLRQLK